LARDGSELRHGRLQSLGILGGVAHPDVEHDLHELRDLVRVLEAELLRELGPHPLLVVVVQPRRRRGLGRGGRRARWLRRTRLRPPDLGSSSITFDAAMGAGNSMIPLSSLGVAARLCFFTTFTPSTTIRNCLGSTRNTLPSLPRCSPEITRTVSPLATWSLYRSGSRCARRARRLFL